MSEIHTTAIIHDGAEIDEDVTIGPFCIIGGNVKIKKGVRLMNNVVVEGDAEIGDSCTVYPFTSIGLAPQDLKYNDEPTGVRIGNRNIIREYTSIHRGSVGGDGYTVIGDDNFMMAYIHIAHDCRVGNRTVMANAVTLAGHVEIEDCAVIGGIVAVHQFNRIGAYAMVGGFSGVTQDVPPYMVSSALGSKLRLYGLNMVGLKRYGFSAETLSELKRAYHILFREGLTLKDAVKKVQEELPYSEEIAHLIEFINANRRGICRPGKNSPGRNKAE